MKFSTVFVLTAAASTGSAAAVKNYIGNLRANSPEQNTEVFVSHTFTTCSASCTPNYKKASTYVGQTEEEIAAAMAACIDECAADASNGDAAARAANSSAETCAKACTGTAAKKFEEVSKGCAKMKSTNCKQGKDCSLTCSADDSSCEKKVKKCVKEFDECEECANEVDDSKNSVKKVGRELNKCFVKNCGAEFSSFRSIALKEAIEAFEDTSLQTDEEHLESCAAQCSPNNKDAKKFVGETEEEVAESIKECVDVCYGITDETTRAAASGEAACALLCADTSAEKFEEVSNKCAKMKSTNCKKGSDCDLECAADDSSCEKKVKKCEKEFEDCEKCADEVKDSENSVKKVAKKYDECLVEGCATQFAVDIAQQ